MAWIDGWEPTGAGGLAMARARATVAYLSETTAVASVVETRSLVTGAEIVVADLRTGSPQRPVVPIDPVERVGIAFSTEEGAPVVVMLREDFPDTEHQQLVPEGFPAAMCLDDRPWDEARLTWTPAELLQRVLLWFRRAARGELHDPHQPVDPFFGLSPFRLVVPASVLTGADAADLAAFRTTADDPNLVTVLPARDLPEGAEAAHLCPVAYEVPPGRMTRMRRAPRDLASLATALADRGVDVVSDLRVRLRSRGDAGAIDRARLDAHLALIVTMPVTAPDGTQVGLIDIRVFVTTWSVGEVGVALGVLHAAGRDVAPSGFARALVAREIDLAALRDCAVEMAQAHHVFDPGRAAALAGRDGPDERRLVLVGAGAIGSHVAEYLAREGRFRWTVVDDDRLLPHNLARHTLRSLDVGRCKAKALMQRLNTVFAVGHPVVERAIDCNVMRPGGQAGELAVAMQAASVVVDATASVAASRHLSDLAADARRASVFFSPSAEAAVVLAEPEDRSVTLRDLEAQYYRAILERDELADHLAAVGERFAYTGACRAVTNRVPESRVALLSSLASGGLSRALDATDAFVGVWSVDSDGRVAVTVPEVSAVRRHVLCGWEVTVDEGLCAALSGMREDALPSETGGALLGVLDAAARRVHVVHALSAPPDSVGSPGGFERGIEGLSEEVARGAARVMGQIRYVGEWHSHPRAHPVAPSPTDLVQIFRGASNAAMEDMPAISVIIGDEGVSVTLAEMVG